MAKFVLKFLADVTGYMNARGPQGLGGSYFAFNIVTSQVGCWIAASLYVAHFDGGNKIEESTIYFFIAALQILWALTVWAFFMTIKREFWGTFVSTKTARQFSMSFFLDNDDDAKRMFIFRMHTDLWSDIEVDVKAYTMANWARWEAERPEWFDEGFKMSVPDRFIPELSLEELKKRGGGVRRRSSAFGVTAAAGEG